jgi:mRNA turnover protein 4
VCRGHFIPLPIILFFDCFACTPATNQDSDRPMPRSKRNKVVVLTATQAKGREQKEELVTKIREAVGAFPNVYTFTLHNSRTNILQNIREDLRSDSRIFMGNNKVMQIALGRDADTSAAPNLYKLSKFLNGLSGLLFTNRSKKDVKDYFAQIGGSVFARSGSKATVPFALEAGPLPQFPHNMFEQLHKLGLPVKLDKGVIQLENDTTVCNVGDELTPEAAQVLRLFGVETAEFKLELTAHWADGVARKIGA